MEVRKEFIDTVEYVARMLRDHVEPTYVGQAPDEKFLHIPVEGMDGVPEVKSFHITTYTLGLMLAGALSMIDEEPRPSTERG